MWAFGSVAVKFAAFESEFDLPFVAVQGFAAGPGTHLALIVLASALAVVELAMSSSSFVPLGNAIAGQTKTPNPDFALGR